MLVGTTTFIDFNVDRIAVDTTEGALGEQCKPAKLNSKEHRNCENKGKNMNRYSVGRGYSVADVCKSCAFSSVFSLHGHVMQKHKNT